MTEKQFEAIVRDINFAVGCKHFAAAQTAAEIAAEGDTELGEQIVLRCFPHIRPWTRGQTELIQARYREGVGSRAMEQTRG